MSITPAKRNGKVIPNTYDVKVYNRVAAPSERPKPTCRRVVGIRAARSLEAKLLADRDRGLQLSPNTTLADYVEEWLAVMRPPAVARKTFENYESRLRSYVLPNIGDLKLGGIRAMHIRRLYAKLEKAGLSGTSRYDVHRTLRRIFSAAIFDGLIHPSADPMRRGPGGVIAPASDTPEVVPLTEAEQDLLLKMITGTTVYVPAVVLLAAGLRRQEVLALKWDAVDLEDGTVSVVAAVEQVGKHVALKTPKSKRSRRTVPIPANVVAVLKAHKAELARVRLQFPGQWEGHGLVFPSLTYHGADAPMGRIWTPNAFNHAWRKALTAGNKAAKEKWVEAGGDPEAYEPLECHPHQLRHTCATGLLMRGRHVEEVSRWLGHANSAITAKVYTHWLPPGDRVEAVVPLPSQEADSGT